MKVLVVDNFRIVMDGLASALLSSRNISVCFKTTDPENFLKENPDVSPEVILLTTAYQASANDIAKKTDRLLAIKHFYPNSKIIVFGNEPDLQITKYLQLGIDGYLSPEDSWKELKECIELVSSGRKYIGMDLLVRLLKVPYSTTHMSVEERLHTLSPIERGVAELLAQGKSVTAIAPIIERTPNNVSKARARVFRKLGVDSVSALRYLLYRTFH